MSHSGKPAHRIGYLAALERHPRAIGFGLLLTFFACFGQTFLVGLFLPDMMSAFAITETTIAALYATATLTTALFLPILGSRIDDTALSSYSGRVAMGLALSCLVLSMADSLPLLFLGLMGLRLTAHGLLSHTASIAIARRFSLTRGRYLSLTGLGYPLGEAILPLSIVFLLHFVGWRWSWATLAVLALVILLPVSRWLSPAVERTDGTAPTRNTQKPPRIAPLILLRDRRFLLLIPGDLAIPFILTGAFLFQMPFAEWRGFSAAATWIGSGFVGFSVARVIFSLSGGVLVDRLTSLRLFPLHLIPLGLGLLVLAGFSAPWTVIVFLFLAGVTQGLASPMRTAVWAEVYGPLRLGTVRSLTATLMVVSTAASPLLVGWALQAGVTFDALIFSGAGTVLCVAIIGHRFVHRLPPDPDSLPKGPVGLDRLPEESA